MDKKKKKADLDRAMQNLVDFVQGEPSYFTIDPDDLATHLAASVPEADAPLEALTQACRMAFDAANPFSRKKGLISGSAFRELARQAARGKPEAADSGITKRLKEKHFLLPYLLTVEAEEIKVEESVLRDLIHFIQGMRKDGGLKSGEFIDMYYVSDEPIKKMIARHKSRIRKKVLAGSVELIDAVEGVFLAQKEVVIDGQKLWLGIRKKEQPKEAPEIKRRGGKERKRRQKQSQEQ